MSSATVSEIVKPLKLDPAEVRFYQQEGYLVLPGFVKPAAVEPLREEILDVLEAHGVSRQNLAHASSDADKLRQFTQYLAGSHLDALINGPATLGTAAQLLDGPANRYMPFTAVKAAGGGGAFSYHQDNNYTPHDPAMGSLNIWVALVDMTPENGCLEVIPRSHLGGQLPSVTAPEGHQVLEVDTETLVPIRMRAGDAIAFTRWTVHGSGQNQTEQPRVAYALQYHRDDVNWYDKDQDVWKNLLETSRHDTAPVETLGPADAG
ncbi:MAG: phytanoyl-CoA dioxygenase family protein [Planctomycetota bacterium]